MDKREFMQTHLPPVGDVRGSREHFAPSNIALCKYWGKRDAQLNLPVNASLSVSLGHLGTRTRVEPLDAGREAGIDRQPD